MHSDKDPRFGEIDALGCCVGSLQLAARRNPVQANV